MEKNKEEMFRQSFEILRLVEFYSELLSHKIGPWCLRSHQVDGERVAVCVAEDASDVNLPADGAHDGDGGVHRRPEADENNGTTCRIKMPTANVINVFLSELSTVKFRTKF